MTADSSTGAVIISNYCIDNGLDDHPLNPGAIAIKTGVTSGVSTNSNITVSYNIVSARLAPVVDFGIVIEQRPNGSINDVRVFGNIVETMAVSAFSSNATGTVRVHNNWFEDEPRIRMIGLNMSDFQITNLDSIEANTSFEIDIDALEEYAFSATRLALNTNELWLESNTLIDLSGGSGEETIVGDGSDIIFALDGENAYDFGQAQLDTLNNAINVSQGADLYLSGLAGGQLFFDGDTATPNEFFVGGSGTVDLDIAGSDHSRWASAGMGIVQGLIIALDGIAVGASNENIRSDGDSIIFEVDGADAYDFTATQADFKGNNIEDLGMINLSDMEIQQVLGGGAISVTQSYIIVQAAAATDPIDDLDNIFTGAAEGNIIVLQAVVGDTITITSAGNFRLAGGVNMTLIGNNNDTFMAIYDGATWNELSRSVN